jgi:small subunit ribosomal protein S6
MFILDTNKVAGDVAQAQKQLHAILERNHAEVLASRPWDERRLAYPIRNHKKGLYYLCYFRTDGKNIVGLSRDFALSELILRNMMLAVEPKLVDIMLEVARGEHAVALQTVTEPPPEDDLGGGGREERRGRRPDRPDRPEPPPPAGEAKD